MAQKQVTNELSAVDALLAIRERNRRLTQEEYMEKVGLGKEFKKFARKKNSKRP